jgi:hypothetical protein
MPELGADELAPPIERCCLCGEPAPIGEGGHVTPDDRLYCAACWDDVRREPEAWA